MELVGDKVEGIAVAVHIGASDRGRGTAVRVLVSGIVKGLTAGQHRLTDRGTRTLKGFREWRLYAARLGERARIRWAS